MRGPERVLAYPWYADNPWQSMLYARLPEHGAEVVPLADVAGLTEALREERTPGSTVLHLNWTAPISQSTPDLALAAWQVRSVLDATDAFRARGGTVVWTVHNVLPHEPHHLGPELALCRGLAERADRVMVMNPDTAALASRWYRLPPERTTVVPHPSYLGRFADDVDRATVRERLGLGESERVLLHLGQIRPYKGLDLLAEAYRRARESDPDLRLLVAGAPGPGADLERTRELLDDLPGVVASLGRVEDDDVQVWMRAADAMVLPYRAALNPSLVWLAATYGLPVLLPDVPALRSLAGPDWVRTFPPTAPGLAAALRAVASPPPGPVAAAAAADARAVAPEVVAARFAEMVREIAVPAPR
ncbi:peptidase M14 [Agromyces rhizosphaerae]|uniref:Peptidase M14 n=1 Tax=Agromyces rhizosphaerae TaxID=88374 RepID=A0A9W6CPF3_9MICO|nr:glycosyltransferase family 4 protein [Agromyces rhizosphaerae]GLI26098.1 peptidase M14 [Agromyces rhizosphaerae]